MFDLIFILKQYNKFLYCFLFLFVVNSIYAQSDIDYNQDRVDVLKQKYLENIESNNASYILLQIIQDETDPDEKLYYSNLLIGLTDPIPNNEIFNKDSTLFYRSTAFLQKGNALQLLGEFHEAVDAYFVGIELAKEDSDEDFAAGLLVSVADTYSMIGNSESAEKYYDEALLLLRKGNDSIALASALLNAGDEYLNTKQYNKALKYFEESGKIFDIKNSQIGKAYNKGNIGMVYAQQGNHELAKNNINDAIAILIEMEDFYPISIYLNAMSDIYVEQQDYVAAIDYAYQSLDLAKDYNLKDQLSDANLQLSNLLELAGNPQEALLRYKDYIVYRDSILNLENIQKIANYDVAQKELEVENLEQKRKNQRIVFWSTVGVLFFIVFLAYGLYKRNKFVHETNRIIEAEKQRSDNLLLNILPEETAQELKEKGKVEAKKFESVTVLFTDFKGFSNYAKNLSPEELVKSVDFYFSKFDSIMEKYGLEKIKTVGDAYMCAGGLPFPTQDHAYKMVLAAKDIAEFVNNEKSKNPDSNTHFDIRIGINTGPVVAGVVGTKKFVYDIWGDAVNIASRMESSSEAGKVNISEYTYEKVKAKFKCSYRGEIEVKNRGKLKMYFVS